MENYDEKNPPIFNFFELKEFKELIKFLKISETIIGLCLFPECEDTISNILNKTINPNLANKILNQSGLEISLYTAAEKIINNYSYLNFYIFVAVIIIYILFRLIIIIYSFVKKEIREELYLPRITQNVIYESNNSTESNISKKVEFAKYFSFKYQLETMLNDESFYFNDKKIIFFSLIKVIIMNFFNFYNSFICFFGNPKLNQDTFHMIKSYTFNIIKLSYFASQLFYFIKGVYFSFKLLGLIFKRKSCGIKEFTYFYLHIFIRLFNIFLIFLLIYYYGNSLIITFADKPILAKTILSKLYNTEESRMIKNSGIFNKLFIPFYYIYYNLTKNPKEYFQPYLRIICLLFNDFYCFTISIIIFYLLFRFKNKIFDTIYAILILALCVKIYFNLGEYEKSDGFGFFKMIYNINSIYKIDHSYICYFFGNLIGIAFFFHIMDAKTDDVLKNKFKGYLPFYFIIKLSKTINNLCNNKTTKNVFTFCLFVPFILLMLALTFNRSDFSGHNLFWTYSVYSRFSVSYEVIIFNFLFSWVIYFAMFIFKLTEISGKKMIYLISRNFSTFMFFSIIGNHYLMAFSQIDMDIYFSNILFYNWVSFWLLLFISLLFNLLFEIPVRILFKKKMRRLFGYENGVNI